MTRSYWYLVLLLTALAMATMGQYAPPFFVLTLALWIFFGTVSLRGHRASDATSTHPGL